jgi:DNA-binding LytR/AlgR family response regulator
MFYNALIADDEKELRKYLRSLLSQVWPDLAICGEAANGEEALQFIESQKPQIAFLDIKMPGLTGLDVAKKIAGICYVVFITAFDNYAVSAFEMEAVDYLLKPVSKERLAETARRLREKLTSSGSPTVEISEAIERALAKISQKESPAFLNWIRVQQKDSVRLIPVEEVDYFKADDKYTAVVTKEGEALIRKSIKELARELDPDRFWQIHRGTIVNVSRIDRMSRSVTGRGVLRLKGRNEALIVGRNYLNLLKQM